MQERIYTVAEICQLLDIRKETAIRYCKIGWLPGAYLRHGSVKLGWRIPQSAIDRLKERERATVVQEPVSRKLETDQSRHTAEQSTGEV